MIATILPIDRAGTYGAGPPDVPASADEDKILLLPSWARQGPTPHYPFAHKPSLRPSHNPQYHQERVPALDHAGNPEGLRDADLGGLLGGPVSTPRRLPQPERCDAQRELPVLRGPRGDDAAGGPRVSRSRQAKRTGLVDSVRAEQVPGARTGGRGPRASGRTVPQRGRSRRARDHRRVAGPRRASRHVGRPTGRAGPPRVPRTVSRPRRGPADQVRTDLQELPRTGRRLLLPSARAGHRDPDRAPPGSRGGGGHAGPRRATGGRVSVLRDPSTRTGPGPARGRGEPSVRRIGAVRGALPVRDLDPPEGPRAGVRDAVRYRRECIRDNPQRRLGSNVSASRRPLVQLLHPHGPAPGVRRDLPLASRDHPSPHGDRRLRTRHRVLHQSGRARGRRIHPERRDPLVRPFAAFGTVTDCLRPWRSYRSLTTTVKLTERVTDPIVAVTVTVYVPGVVKSEVEIVNVEVAVPFAANITLLGLTETVGHTKTRPDDEIEALRLAVPDRPLRLVSVIVEEPDEPHRIVRELGEAPRPKSGGGGGGGGGAVTEIECDWIAVSPPESTAWTMTV